MTGTRGRLTRTVWRTVAAVALTAAVAVAPAPPATAFRGGPADGSTGESVGDLLVRLRELYRRTETADAAYRAAEEELRAQRSRVTLLQRRLAGTRVRLDALRDEAGRIARWQYQDATGMFPPHLRLLLGRDAREVRAVVEHGRVLDRLAARQTTLASQLTDQEAQLDALATRARRVLDQRRVLTARHERQRDAVRQRLTDVERLLASLTDEELAWLRRAERVSPWRPPPGGEDRAGVGSGPEADLEPGPDAGFTPDTDTYSGGEFSGRGG
ncbi:MAG TPA: hypothetical protein VFY14_05105 [Streptomyces sp.]|nr:hypothetical protein [Streptomyces sp.]